MSLFSRTDKSLFGQWWWTVDRVMLAAILSLSLVGVILVATASPAVAVHIGLGDFHFLKRHLLMLIPALGMMITLSFMPKRLVRRIASLVFLASLAAMMLVLVSGSEIKGAQRWIRVLGFSLQPSEFVKPAFAVMAAWMMALEKESSDERKFSGTVVTGGLYAMTVTLLLMQPDFGMTFIVTLIWAAQIFIAGLKFRYLILLMLAGVIGILGIYNGFDHVKSRIDRYLDPDKGDNFQVEKSLEAFREGGIMGAGPGQGSVKTHLPDAHADFIFSVAGEEMGLFFVTIIIGIYGFIMIRGLNRLMNSSDMFTVLAAGGLLTMFGLQALVHMGSAMQLLPAKGMTLPFISYGGSSLLAMGFTFGVILSLTRRTVKKGIAKGGLSLQTPKEEVSA